MQLVICCFLFCALAQRVNGFAVPLLNRNVIVRPLRMLSAESADKSSSTSTSRLDVTLSDVEMPMQEKPTADVVSSSTDTIQWRAGVKSSCKVKESSRTAEQYMALPATEYSVLSANQIERLSDTQFKATMGKLNFFGNDFIPILYVDVIVYPEESRAEILVTRAETVGSEIAEQVNGTFDIYAKNSVSVGVDDKGRKVLISDTNLQIDVTPPEDSKIPTRLIRSGGNFVIQQSLNLIVPTFVRLLARDFRIWSAGSDDRGAIEGAAL